MEKDKGYFEKSLGSNLKWHYNKTYSFEKPTISTTITTRTYCTCAFTETSLSRGGVYYHYKNKVEILHDVMREGIDYETYCILQDTFYSRPYFDKDCHLIRIRFCKLKLLCFNEHFRQFETY